jgi:hypothetical protein
LSDDEAFAAEAAATQVEEGAGEDDAEGSSRA